MADCRIARGAPSALACAALAAGCAAPQDNRQPTELPLRNILQQQADAWNRGDLDAFMAPYWHSEDLTFSSGGATTRGWDATYRRYQQRYPTRERMGTLEFTDLELRPLGQRHDAALLLGRWRLTRSDGPLGGNFSLVFVDFPGAGWQIVHDHTSVQTPLVD